MKKNNSSPVPICEIFLSQVYNELCDQSSSVECISQQVDALTKLIRERRDFHITSDIVWKNIFQPCQYGWDIHMLGAKNRKI